MNGLHSSSQDTPSAAIQAEAAAWVARLHGPRRSIKVDQGLRRWLELSVQHRRAFEIASETWEKIGQLQRRPTERVARWERSGIHLRWRHIAAAAALLLVIGIPLAIYRAQHAQIATAVGEQRTLTLEDGTRVTLNTRTRILVSYGRQARHIDLQDGEALFQVAQDAARPFTVFAGGREIKALGTSFVVRDDPKQLMVTLIEGKVIVAALDNAPIATLTPGQRVVLRDRAAPRVDRPAIEKLTAWQRGQVAFDDTPLAEAVAEMNRYSSVRLAVESPEAARLRISGVFRSAEAREFARAIAATYQLQIIDSHGQIHLAGQPQAPRDDTPLSGH